MRVTVMTRVLPAPLSSRRTARRLRRTRPGHRRHPVGVPVEGRGLPEARQDPGYADLGHRHVPDRRRRPRRDRDGHPDDQAPRVRPSADRAMAHSLERRARRDRHFVPLEIEEMTVSAEITELTSQPLLLLMLAVYLAELGTNQLGADLTQSELYQRIMDRFISRQITEKTAPDASESEQKSAAASATSAAPVRRDRHVQPRPPTHHRPRTERGPRRPRATRRHFAGHPGPDRGRPRPRRIHVRPQPPCRPRTTQRLRVPPRHLRRIPGRRTRRRAPRPADARTASWRPPSHTPAAWTTNSSAASSATSR